MSKSLGRGLGAILEDVEESYIKDLGDKNESIKEILIDNIIPNPYQPRKFFNTDSLNELADSIEKQGLMQPIILVEDDNEYILIAGERRLRAHKLLKKEKIKAIVVDFDLSKLREYAIVENLQREDLNVIELANSLYELIQEHSYTHEEVAKIISKSRSYVTNILRLLKLSNFCKTKLLENQISFSHAKILVNLEKEMQEQLVKEIIDENLTTKNIENRVRIYKKEKKYNLTVKEKKVDNYQSELFEILNKIEKKYLLNISKSNNSLIINVTSKKDLKKIKKIFNI